MSPSEPAAHRGLRPARFEALSDGVFAVAITLLVLDIAVPEGTGDLLGALVDLWPAYLGYAASFSTIGAVWLAHSAATEHLDHVDSALVRINLLLLMVVAFLPFPTRLLAQHLGDGDGARVSAVVYGTTLLVIVVLLALLWRYALRAGLVRSDADEEQVRSLTSRLTPGVGGYVAMLVVGLVLPTLAVVGYLAIALLLAVPRGLSSPEREGGRA